MERLAVLPANLLISDPASEWLKVGIPVVLQHDLMTAHTLIPGFAPDEAAATQGGATRVLRTSIENRNGGFHVVCTVVDPATHKVVRTESADASTASVLLPALNTLARKIDPAAMEFPTKSTPVWQAFASAAATNNPQQRAQLLNHSISLDQNFGLGWVSLMDMIVPNGQTDLKRMIEDAKSHRNAFAPFDRAKIDVALARLTNAAPAEQIRAVKQSLALAPNDLDALTTLGNVQILQGDAAAGEQSLRHAIELNPTNTGLRFQLARGLMEVRKFKDAEAIFTSMGKTPAVYPELATCVLLQGDKQRAATIFEKFLASVQNDELKSLLRASWEVMSGDRQKGIDLALASKFKTPNVQSFALSEAAIWQIMGGDFASAQKTAALLAQNGGQNVAFPSVLNLLVDKSSASPDWQSKVQNAQLPDNFKQSILGYGLFLRGNYDDASKVWQRISNASHGADLHARAMLASSLNHVGNAAGAHIVVMPFSPEFTDLYSAVSFTEMRRLLGKS